MTRRTAQHRFDELPEPPAWPPTGEDLATVIRALVHPGRRRLLDALASDGPASVGRLARRSGMAVGSVSHHLRVLAAAGLVTTAPELAGDTRESWWRAEPREVSFGPADFAPGTAGAELADAAGRAGIGYLLDAIRGWMGRRSNDSWHGTVSDTVARASQEQLDDLSAQLSRVLAEWTQQCRSTPAPEGVPTRGVRAVTFVFPEAPRD